MFKRNIIKFLLLVAFIVTFIPDVAARAFRASVQASRNQIAEFKQFWKTADAIGREGK